MPLLPTLDPESFAQTYRTPAQPVPHLRVRNVVSFVPQNPEPQTVGTVFVSDRCHLFSPNTARLPGFLPSVDESSLTGFDPTAEWPSAFRVPRWWQEDTGYLAFYPLNPKFEVEPFRELFQIESHARYPDRRGFTLSATRKLQWYTLEWRLRLLIQVLSLRYDVPPMLDVIDTFRVVGFHKKRRDFANAFHRSISWFGILMAKVSYLVAVAHSVDDEEVDIPDHPGWFRLLLSMKFDGLDEPFLDSVRAVMGRFGPEIPRTGVILDLMVSPPHQFSVHWLKRVRVPVYYRCGDFEQSMLPRWLQIPSELMDMLGYMDDWASNQSTDNVCYALASTYVPPSALSKVVARRSQMAPPMPGNTAPVSPELVDVVDINSRPVVQSTSPSSTRVTIPTTPLPIEDIASEPIIPIALFSVPSDDVRSPPRPVRPWLPFLEERRKKTELLILRESPGDRQARLQREANPPTVNTVVFVWEEDGEDSYKRVRISKKFNFETLCDFSERQKVYNAVFNEWDCGYDFYDEPDDDNIYNDKPASPQPLSHSSDAIDTVVDNGPMTSHPDDMVVDVAPSSTIINQTPLHPPPSPSNLTSLEADDNALPLVDLHDVRGPPSNFAEVTESFDLTGATEDLMTLYRELYGFIPPLSSLSHPAVSLPVNDITKLRACVGLKRDDCADLITPHALHLLHDFMKNAVLPHRTAPSKVPSACMESWDLVVGNREHLAMSSRFKALRRITDGDQTFYYFDHGSRRHEPWFVAVPSITAALYICRLHSQMSDYEVCMYLVNWGIPFRTWLSFRPRAPLHVPPRMPIRRKPIDYVFTRRDYEIYVSHRRDVLANTRTSRAAALRGGIIWRLCELATVRDSACMGPTKYVTELGIKESFANSMHDDFISLDELDMISGTYVLPTGNGDQTVTLSWWPPYSSWVRYYNFDHWTNVMEVKFHNRLLDLDKGIAQPLPLKKWKEWIRGGSSVRDARTSIANASLAFFNEVGAVDTTT